VSRRRAAIVVPLAALALAAAGCGGDDEPASTAPPTATTGVPVGGVTQTQTQTQTRTPTPTQTASTGESGAGGAGDEEAIRTPVALTAAGGTLSPTTVTVPAFLALEITVTAKDAGLTATIDAPGGGTLAVPAGGRATKRLAGLKPGDYVVSVPDGGKTTLHVVNGGDPGP